MTEDELEWRFRELKSRIEKVESQHKDLDRRTIAAAYSVGAALATVLSWNVHQAIALAALHGSVFVVLCGVLHRNELGTLEVLLTNGRQGIAVDPSDNMRPLPTKNPPLSRTILTT